MSSQLAQVCSSSQTEEQRESAGLSGPCPRDKSDGGNSSRPPLHVDPRSHNWLAGFRFGNLSVPRSLCSSTSVLGALDWPHVRSRPGKVPKPPGQ